MILNKLKIRGKLLWPFFLLFIAGIGISSLISINYHKKSIREDINEIVSTNTNKINKIRSLLNQTALSHANIIAKEPRVIELYQLYYAGAREDSIQLLLQGHLIDLHHALNTSESEQYDIQFHLPPATAFARSWSYKYGEDLSRSRPSLVKLYKSKKAFSCEEYIFQHFYIIGLAPIFSTEGKYLGSVEVQISFKTALENSKDSDKEEFTVWGIEDQSGVHELMTDYTVIGRYLLASKTSGIVKTDLLKPSDLSLYTQANDTIIQRGNYLFSGGPIYDINDKVHGFFLFQYKREDELITRFYYSNFFFISIAVIIGILIMFWFMNHTFIKPLHELNEKIMKTASGRLDIDFETDKTDELGQMSKSLSMQLRGLKETAHFAENIGKGKLDAEFTPLSKDDQLGKSLLDMREKLLQASEEEQKRKEEDQLRNWITRGQARFSDILRQDNKNLSDQANAILKFVTEYLGAIQGAIFVVNDEEASDLHLEMVGTYAYDRSKHVQGKIYPGQGQTGTCLQEKKTIYIKNTPSDYLRIKSGLGDESPGNILIVPLKVEEDIFGVLELASFQPFKEHEVEFVELIGENIASTLSYTKVSANTSALLEESQQQRQEMQAQEEEMRQNLEELQATQEEMARKESEISGIISAVDGSILRAEVDFEGSFISINERFTEIFGYDIKDLSDQNIRLMIPDEEMEKFEADWKNIVKGEMIKETRKRKDKEGKDVWLLVSYSALEDKEGHASKVLILAHDITEQKVAEIALANKSKELEEQEKSLKATLTQLNENQEKLKKKSNEAQEIISSIDERMGRVEYDTEGHVISVNEMMEELTGLPSSVLEKHNLYELQKEETGLGADGKSRLEKGEQINCDIKYHTAKDTEIWLRQSFLPVMNDEGQLEKVIYLAMDVSAEITINDELKRLKEKQEATTKSDQQKIDELNQEKERLREELQREFAEKEKAISENIQSDAKAQEEKLKTLKQELEEQNNKLKEELEKATTQKEDEIQRLKNELQEAEKRISELGKNRQAEGKTRGGGDALPPEIDESILRLEYSPNGKIISANQRYLDKTGYSLEEVLGKETTDFLHGEDEEMFNFIWQDVLQGKRFEGLLRRIAATGKDLWIHGVFIPIMDESNECRKVLFIGHDISEFKK